MSAWEDYKERLREFRGGVKPWDLLKADNYTDEATAEQRMSLCRGCEFLTAHTEQCRKCGCFMAAKTKLALATCPIGKW